MKLWKYLLYVFSGIITASKAYHVMMNSSGTGNQPSISLLCDIMMYKDKDISSIITIKWGLKHEATALSADLKKFMETHRTVEVVRPGLLTHKKYSYTRESPDAIISCNCHGFNIIESKCLLDVKLVSIQLDNIMLLI
jgi:hypothetical protein